MKMQKLHRSLFVTLFLVGCSVSSDRTKYGNFSQKDDFLADPVTGCLVDKYYLKSDDPNLFRWKGQCVNGFAIGLGRLSWYTEAGVESFHDTCLHPENSAANCYTGGGMP